MGSRYMTVTGNMVRERSTLRIICAKFAALEVHRPLWQRATLRVTSPMMTCAGIGAMIGLVLALYFQTELGAIHWHYYIAPKLGLTLS